MQITFIESDLFEIDAYTFFGLSAVEYDQHRLHWEYGKVKCIIG